MRPDILGWFLTESHGTHRLRSLCLYTQKHLEESNVHREHLASRLGFILLSAGCAIGIGNVWKFPWMTGQYGGGTFVVIYLIFLLILGVPVLTMEFAMGRAAQKSPLKMYQALKPADTGAGTATSVCSATWF